MDNVQVHELVYNRSWVTFDNFFPKHVLDELVCIVNTHEQISWNKEFRNTINRLVGSSVDHYFIEQVPKHILAWSGQHVTLDNWWCWIDYPGLEYPRHRDPPSHKHFLQVYLNDQASELGIRIHAQPYGPATDQAPYKLNSGVYLNSPNSISHSVSQVPKDNIRMCVVAMYN